MGSVVNVTQTKCLKGLDDDWMRCTHKIIAYSTFNLTNLYFYNNTK